MLIFLDTEFTGLNQRDTRLISLALVPADGRAPFYVELAEGDGWTRDDCSSFVLDEVLAANVSYRDGPTRAEMEEIFLTGVSPPRFMAHMHHVLTETSWRIIEDAAKQITNDPAKVLAGLRKIGEELER